DRPSLLGMDPRALRWHCCRRRSEPAARTRAAIRKMRRPPRECLPLGPHVRRRGHGCRKGGARWQPVKSLWISGMTLAVLFGGPVHFTGGALALFPATTATTLRLCRGRGSHRYQRTQQALWRPLSQGPLAGVDPVAWAALRRRIWRGQAGRVLDG